MSITCGDTHSQARSEPAHPPPSTTTFISASLYHLQNGVKRHSLTSYSLLCANKSSDTITETHGNCNLTHRILYASFHFILLCFSQSSVVFNVSIFAGLLWKMKMQQYLQTCALETSSFCLLWMMAAAAHFILSPHVFVGALDVPFPSHFEDKMVFAVDLCARK